MPATRFYFDLGSPYAYLVAERISTILPQPIEWQPILLGGIFRLTGRSSWSLGDPERRAAGMAIVEARAQAYGLPAVRWPDPWPSDYLHAMRACTYAFKAGAGREFAMQAFRDAFQGGVDLSILANVLRAGQEAGIDSDELETAIGAPETKHALRQATDSAHALGVIGVPTIAIGRETFWGDDRLQEAAARLRA
jgi:2-hydroxychromene-2-carboxylate isomerase